MGNYKARYSAQQDAKNFELGFVGVMSAPIAILGAPELSSYLLLPLLENSSAAWAARASGAIFDVGNQIS